MNDERNKQFEEEEILEGFWIQAYKSGKILLVISIFSWWNICLTIFPPHWVVSVFINES